MPIYTLICKNCQKEFDTMLGIRELDNKDSNNLDLEDIGVTCPACKKSEFSKKLTPHAASSHNWSAWQRKS